MPERIIEINSDGRHLGVYRGFMTVSEKGQEITRIALDDIAGLIASAHGLTYSNNLLVELAKRNASFVLCGSNYLPVAYLWPVQSHHRQAGRLDAQIALSLPQKKSIWKQIVKAKIEHQAAVLEAIGAPNAPVLSLAGKVRSGDPDNIEAQAARRYWPLLFGKAFRRDQDAVDENMFLNYGYTILRSSVARAVLGAGLHPGIPLFHKNALNPMRLVDDVMEPFRPIVDMYVWTLLTSGCDNLNADAKRSLAGILEMEVPVSTGMTALRTAIHNTATSLARIYEGKCATLDLPDRKPPLWMHPDR